MQRVKDIIIAILLITLVWVWNANAGSPAGPGTTPDSTSSYTIEDIYQRLNAGTAGEPSTFTEPSVALDRGTMHTLNEVMSKAPAQDNTNGALTTEVLSGKTFWGLNAGSNEWGLQTGTMIDTGAVTAGVPKTGQTICYNSSGSEIDCSGTGQDGDKLAGVESPSPRFTDNGNGTVTDNLTGLIWLSNANCANAQRSWATALSDVTQLNTDGMMNNNNCGDTSNNGSHQTDWRLPNVRELQNLIDYGQVGPALPQGHPFTSVQSYSYWSSSTYTGYPTDGWGVYLSSGYAYHDKKTNGYYVWPVRGG